jgi:hypothetical protein
VFGLGPSEPLKKDLPIALLFLLILVAGAATKIDVGVLEALANLAGASRANPGASISAADHVVIVADQAEWPIGIDFEQTSCKCLAHCVTPSYIWDYQCSF